MMNPTHSDASSSSHSRDLGLLGQGTRLVIAGQALALIVGPMTAWALVNVLGLAGYGAYSIVMALLAVLGVIQSLGLGTGLVYFVVQARERKDPRQFRTIVNLAIIMPASIGLVFAVGLYWSAPFVGSVILGSIETVQMLALFALILPLKGTSDVLLSLTRGFDTQYYLVLGQSVIDPLVRLLGFWGIWMIYQSLSFEERVLGIVLVTGVSALLCLLIGMIGLRLLWEKTSTETSYARDWGMWTTALPMLRYSIPVTVGDIFQQCLLWIDTFVVGRVLGVSEAGMYRIAALLAKGLQGVLGAIGVVFAPIIARCHGSQDWNRLESLYYTATRWALLLSLPVALTLFIFSNQILALFSVSSAEAVATLRILLAGQLFNIMVGNVGIIITMAGLTKFHAWNGFLAFVVGVAANIILIPTYGMYGAAVASAAIVVAINILRVVQVWRAFRFHPFSRDVMTVIPSAMVCVLLVMACWLVERHIPGGVFVVLPMAIIVAVSSMWGTYALTQARVDDLAILKGVMGNMSRILWPQVRA